jgi:hypothetical protein
MDENKIITPSAKVQAEALQLSDEILKNVELGEIPLASIFLKTARLARLLNDFDMLAICQYEVSG